MRVRRAALLAIVLLAAHPALVPASIALAECGSPPAATDSVPVKYAFTAIVRDVSDNVDPPVGEGAPFTWHVELETTKVYAGEVADELRINGWNVGCSLLRPRGLKVGDQLFVTLDRLNLQQNPSLFGQVLVWKRVGDGWAFAERALAGGSDEAYWPAEARQATSTAAILAIVNAGGLPDTSSATTPLKSRGADPLGLLAVAFLVAIWALLGLPGGRGPFARRATASTDPRDRKGATLAQ